MSGAGRQAEATTVTATARLQLPDVTLVCVDTRTPDLALAAMQRCRERVDFAAALLFTDPSLTLAVPEGIQRLPLQIDSVPAYSQFMLRGLTPHIHTSHLLVVQWDGWLTHPAAWTPEFLQCDYIGPPWVDQPVGREVGNGGFSLRSRRLLQALADPAIAPSHPEDVCICRDHRDRLESVHGLRFAPLALAQRFGHEHEAPTAAAPALGFHGVFNLHRVLDDAALGALLAALSPSQCWGLGGRMLFRSLLQAGRLHMAGLLLDRAAPLVPMVQRLRYRARLWAAGWRAGAKESAKAGAA